MFEQAMAVELGRGRRAYTTLAGAAGQALLVGTALLLPLVSPHAPPRTEALVTLFFPGAPPAPDPPPLAERAAPPNAAVHRVFQEAAGRLTAPRTAPARAAIIEDPPLAAAEFGAAAGRGGVPGGIGTGIPGALAGEAVRSVPPPAPPAASTPAPVPAAAAAPIVRLKVGGQVKMARPLRQPMPVYPALAKQARISGTVLFSAVIGTDGRIRDLKLVRGHPLLVQAAFEAVRQWVYEPTYLNGDPVEVDAPISVMFSLN